MSTPACKDGANLDDNHPNGRRAKSKHGHTDDPNNPFNPKNRGPFIMCAFFFTFIISLCCMIVIAAVNEAQPPGVGDLFVRLIGKSGLDPGTSPPTSPAFHLALDFNWTPRRYRRCSGGGNSLLRVSYHDMILAWAQVPHFCVYGHWGIDSVGTFEVEAKAPPCCERRCATCFGARFRSWGRSSSTWKERWRA
ncbi:hypothetical protein VPH35_090269 [Triticum aestivum]|uniref:Uncharacterized protein n=1 Tax=Triticum aestivum TaxID=4565 RepID=A0A3B6LKT5_WHEAT